ncbi:hypothetical protein GP486_001866 [Trichoglossum hirsutum]|uniref:Uncharacterized protein n=1 Tax=Trichoglossum hirsutum TaxID=265104 RepID=A0A9P8RSN8_9PEZI|nr:hypothetical protein GP486_001866 [Trichoglossum hirsutum]
MGNLCGKESSDHFAGPGRQLGSSHPQAASGRTAVPQGNSPKIPDPGASRKGTYTDARGEAGSDARRQAALAAERRAGSAKPKSGRQTKTNTSRVNTAEDLDENTRLRSWD